MGLFEIYDFHFKSSSTRWIFNEMQEIIPKIIYFGKCYTDGF
jgi:hypothetical protein